MRSAAAIAASTLLAAQVAAAAPPEVRATSIPGIQIRSSSDAGPVSISKDGGATWSEPRVMSHEIKLLAGAFVPGGPGGAGSGVLAARPGSTLRLVQLRTPSLAAFRERLAALGAEVLAWIPESAHLVRMSAAVEEQVKAETFVRWVGPYHPAYRIEPELVELAADPARAAGRRRYILMTLTPGAAEKGLLAAQVRALGGTVTRETPGGYLIDAELTGAELAEIVHSDHLLWVERWSAPEDDMDLVRSVCGADYIETLGSYSGQGVVGEVLDGGTDLTHQDFDGIRSHGTVDPGAHGTSTYGIVFGNGARDGDGNAQALGMLPSAQGYAADYSYLTDRYRHTQDLVEPPIQALFQSNSWGAARTLHYGALSNEMDDIVWLHDFTIFQSQSNSGDQYSRPQAWAKNVVSVGGIVHSNTANLGDDCFCNGASIGPAEDGRLKPELSHWYDSVYTTNPGNSYTQFGGTSAATPIVAGYGGLVYQMWAANIYGNNPPGTTVFEKRPHTSTLKALMINTAAAYDFTQVGSDMQRERQGWGLPSASNVLDRARMTRVVDETKVLREFEFVAYSATVPAAQPELKVTMVYTDRAATPGAAVHRVNDVSLKVIAPDGTIYWGNNGILTALYSSPGGAPDRINTVENVFVQNPMAGTWRVEVYADEVNLDQHAETPEADQDFALVVYGVNALDECSAAVTRPGGLAASPGGANTVNLRWTGTAASYEIWRAVGGCGMPRVLAGTSTGPTFTDAGVTGAVPVGYTVRSNAGCPSPFSTCVEITPSGNCTVAPSFAGLVSAGAAAGASCGIRLRWEAGTSLCAGPITYNIYRSTDPAFTPGPASRIASCVSGPSFLDSAGLSQSTEYTYVVRAGTCDGVEDGNLLRRTLTPLTLYRTDFELGVDGWSLLEFNDGVTGEFVIDDPEGTVEGGNNAQPEDDHTVAGTKCLFTGRNPNRSPFQADVDFDTVEATSPIFDASGFTAAAVTLWRWHYNRDLEADANDFFEVQGSNDGGASWVSLERLGNTTSANAWTLRTFALGPVGPLTANMRLRVLSSDGQAMSNTIESAVDDIEVKVLSTCATGANPPGVIAGSPGPLLVAKSGASARFVWGGDCGGGTAYGVYQGNLSTGLPSLAPVSGLCSVTATTVDLPMAPAGAFFYLIAPNDGASEGSLGLLDVGVRRPQPAGVCFPRSASIHSCAP